MALSRSIQRDGTELAGPLANGPAVLAEIEFPQLLIFDWHGTLVDTLDAVYASVQDVLLELEPLGLLEALADEHAKAIAHKAYNTRYREHAGAVAPFQSGLPEYLQLFRAAGLQLAVATNRSREFLEAELLALTASTGFDWPSAFDVLVCADDVDSYSPGLTCS